MRSLFGIDAESAFKSVVLPEPVPPDTSMLSCASMQRDRNSADSSEIEPMLIMSSRVRRRFENFRIVISGPESDSGGMIAFTRLPSGRRASTIGDASSMRRPIWDDDLVDDAAEMRLVREPDGRLVQLSSALDPDVVGAVAHDLGDRVVREQALERPVAEDVVEDLGRQPVAILACEAGFVVQMPPDVRHDAVPELGGIDRDVEELWPELRDDRHVNLVLQFCERLLLRGSRPPAARDSLVEFHGYAFLPKSSRRRERPSAAADGQNRLLDRSRSACEQLGQTPERLGRLDCGLATTIGIPSFTVRGISRSEGMKTSGVRPSTASTSDWLIPTRLCARFRSRKILSGSYFISSSVSSPSFVFLRDRESSIPTMTTCVAESIDVITSAVKPGGVSTMTQS